MQQRMLDLSHVKKNRFWLQSMLLLLSLTALETHLAAIEPSYLSETTYEWEMDNKVLPFWKQGEEGYLDTADKHRIFYRRFIHPSAKAQVVFVHGFTENILKYRELAYDFYQRGYSVLLYDNRGHGRSVHSPPNPNIVHVDRFQQYIDDFKLMIEHRLPHPNRPLFAFGHSMGAAIVAAYMAAETHSIQAAVLSTPMIDPQTSPAPTWFAQLLTQTSDWLGAASKPILIQSRITPDEWTLDHSATGSLARFTRFRQDNLRDGLFLSGASNRWLQEAMAIGDKLRDSAVASRISVPIFLSLAEFDPRVDPESVRKWCKTITDCRIRYYSGSKHEVWNERDPIRRLFLDDVFTFFQYKLDGKHWVP